LPQPWRTPYGKPERIASALDIMLEGPIGAASFNKRIPGISKAKGCTGYFRT
jgi:phosphoribosylformylglycinamidine synthase